MDSGTSLIVGLLIGLLVGLVVGALVMAVRRSRYDAAHGQAGSGADSPEVLAARHEAALAELRAVEGAARAELQSAEAAARGQLQAELASAQASLAALREQAAQQQPHSSAVRGLSGERGQQRGGAAAFARLRAAIQELLAHQGIQARQRLIKDEQSWPRSERQ